MSRQAAVHCRLCGMLVEHYLALCPPCFVGFLQDDSYGGSEMERFVRDKILKKRQESLVRAIRRVAPLVDWDQ